MGIAKEINGVVYVIEPTRVKSILRDAGLNTEDLPSQIETSSSGLSEEKATKIAESMTGYRGKFEYVTKVDEIVRVVPVPNGMSAAEVVEAIQGPRDNPGIQKYTQAVRDNKQAVNDMSKNIYEKENRLDAKNAATELMMYKADHLRSTERGKLTITQNGNSFEISHINAERPVTITVDNSVEGGRAKITISDANRPNPTDPDLLKAVEEVVGSAGKNQKPIHSLKEWSRVGSVEIDTTQAVTKLPAQRESQAKLGLGTFVSPIDYHHGEGNQRPIRRVRYENESILAGMNNARGQAQTRNVPEPIQRLQFEAEIEATCRTIKVPEADIPNVVKYTMANTDISKSGNVKVEDIAFNHKVVTHPSANIAQAQTSNWKSGFEHSLPAVTEQTNIERTAYQVGVPPEHLKNLHYHVKGAKMDAARELGIPMGEVTFEDLKSGAPEYMKKVAHARMEQQAGRPVSPEMAEAMQVKPSTATTPRQESETQKITRNAENFIDGHPDLEAYKANPTPENLAKVKQAVAESPKLTQAKEAVSQNPNQSFDDLLKRSEHDRTIAMAEVVTGPAQQASVPETSKGLKPQPNSKIEGFAGTGPLPKRVQENRAARDAEIARHEAHTPKPPAVPEVHTPAVVEHAPAPHKPGMSTAAGLNGITAATGAVEAAVHVAKGNYVQAAGSAAQTSVALIPKAPGLMGAIATAIGGVTAAYGKYVETKDMGAAIEAGGESVVNAGIVIGSAAAAPVVVTTAAGLYTGLAGMSAAQAASTIAAAGAAAKGFVVKGGAIVAAVAVGKMAVDIQAEESKQVAAEFDEHYKPQVGKAGAADKANNITIVDCRNLSKFQAELQLKEINRLKKESPNATREELGELAEKAREYSLKPDNLLEYMHDRHATTTQKFIEDNNNKSVWASMREGFSDWYTGTHLPTTTSEADLIALQSAHAEFPAYKKSYEERESKKIETQQIPAQYTEVQSQEKQQDASSDIATEGNQPKSTYAMVPESLAKISQDVLDAASKVGGKLAEKKVETDSKPSNPEQDIQKQYVENSPENNKIGVQAKPQGRC